MNKNVLQHDYYDCGAACLKSIAAHYKLDLSIARIRQYACTDMRGTNVMGMIKAAERIGFTAKDVKEMKVNTTTEATRTSHILFYGMRRRQFTSVIFFPKSITSVLGKKYLTENIIQNT